MFNNVIEIQNLTKIYNLYDKPIDRFKETFHPFRKKYHNKFYALKEVNIEIKKGETIGIIGKNGSGKSTLLKLILGILTPTIGDVKVKGKVSSLLELGTGFNPELTGIENIYFYGTINGLSRKQIDNRLHDILNFADISSFINQPVKTYSSGMFVRLAFSCAIQVEPEILIIDEALAVGDAFFVHKCMLKIKEMKESGVTILLVAHDSSTVKSICTRAIWFHNGEIKKNGDPIIVSDEYISFLFNQNIILDSDFRDIQDYKLTKESNLEFKIENIDRRIGDQKCMIMGIGIYNEHGRDVKVINNNQFLQIRVSFKNLSEESLNFSLGYILRNSRGFDIASSNSIDDGFFFPNILPNEIKTGIIKLKIPKIQQGSYSISIGVSYLNSKGILCEADRIENCSIIEVISLEKIHVMMKFDSDYKIEEVYL